MITAIVHGEARHLEDGATLAELLRILGADRPGIAIAVNDEVVPRTRFGEHQLHEGDAVEIIRAVAGG